MAKSTAGDGEKAKRGAAKASTETTARTRSNRAQAPEDAAAGIPPQNVTGRKTPGAAAKTAKSAKPAAGAKPKEGGGRKTAAPKTPAAEANDLRSDLRAFASARPEGWGHDDWLSFLDHLRGRGHDTADEGAVGLALERERLAVVLERIAGMGPRRVATLVERYDTWWSLRHADVDELARLPGMNRALAERVKQEVR